MSIVDSRQAKALLALGDLEPEAAALNSLEIVDEPSQLAEDRLPTADKPETFPTYRDWDPAKTEVVVCRIANDVYPGRPFQTRDEARRTIERERGRILEANYVPGRAFFRVRKQ